jgi:hypothetical protein
MITAYAITGDSPFCNADRRVDDLINRLTSFEAMHATRPGETVPIRCIRWDW